MFTNFALIVQRSGLLALARLGLSSKKLRGKKLLPPHLLTGIRGELEAFFYLRHQGFIVVARRWRSPELNGDLDLVAWEGDTLCFVEVKTRSRRDQYEARSSVDAAKQRTLRRMARLFRQATIPRDARRSVQYRFDVVSIYLTGHSPECELLRHAFPAQDESRSPRFGV